MLYIVSQDGLRITDLHSATVVSPENDRYDDGTYKIYVNGAKFAEYPNLKSAEFVLNQIKTLIHNSQNTYYELPKT